MASTSAAIVLPVPLAPANSALMPKPAHAFRGEAPALVHRRALPNVRRDFAQNLPLRLRQHEIVPGGGGLDALCQAIQTLARLNAAGIPKRRGHNIISRRRWAGVQLRMRSVDLSAPRLKCVTMESNWPLSLSPIGPSSPRHIVSCSVALGLPTSK